MGQFIQDAHSSRSFYLGRQALSKPSNIGARVSETNPRSWNGPKPLSGRHMMPKAQSIFGTGQHTMDRSAGAGSCLLRPGGASG